MDDPAHADAAQADRSIPTRDRRRTARRSTGSCRRPTARTVAVSLSKGGSEDGDAPRARPRRQGARAALIADVQRGTAGGDVAWTPDGKGFYYTRYPRGGERRDDERDFYHAGVVPPARHAGRKDRYEIGKDLPKIAEIMLDSDAQRPRARVGAERRRRRVPPLPARPARAWRQFDDLDDGVVQARSARRAICGSCRATDAPRGKVLRLPATTAKLGAGARS